MFEPGHGHHGIFIHHLKNHLLVHYASRNAWRLRDKLELLGREALQQQLEKRLQDMGLSSDPGLLLIERIELDFSIHSAAKASAILDNWAQKLSHQLLHCATSKHNTAGVIYFESPIHFLKQFLVDVAAGQAWSKWYYKDFSGLKMLPTGSAIRTAIMREPLNGYFALLQLNDSEEKQILNTMSELERRYLLVELSAALDKEFPTKLSSQKLLNLLLESGILEAYLLEQNHWLTSYRLFFDCCRKESQAAGRSLAIYADALLRLRYLWNSASPEQRSALVQLLRKAEWQGLKPQLGDKAIEALHLLLQLDKEDREQIVQNLSNEGISANKIVPDDVHAERLSTSFGAAFLLLPIFSSLIMPAIKEQILDAENFNGSSLFALLWLAACLGRNRASLLWNDVTIRKILDLPMDLSIEAIQSWQNSIRGETLGLILQLVRDTLRQWGSISLQTIFIQPVADRHLNRQLLIDCERGICIASRTENEFFAGWQAHEDVETIIAAADFHRDYAALFPKARFYEKGSDYVANLRLENKQLGLLLDSEDEFNQSWHHISLHGFWGLNAEFAAFLSVLAQMALRCFAGRLPGYSRSSLPFIYENFLSQAAEIEASERKWIVYLEHVPLSLILNITGMSRQAYSLEWLSRNDFHLTDLEA